MKISKLTLATSAAALVVGAALVLTGCSAGGSAGTTKKDAGSGTSNSQSQNGAGRDGQGGAGGFGGAAGGGTVGTIADVSGSTLQVQSSSDQTAVTFSSSTAITQTVSVALSAVKVGDCVVATTTPASASTGSTSSSSSDASDGPVTSVAISEPVNGACTGGFGGRAGTGDAAGGQRPSGFPTDRPRSTDRPSNRPTDGSGRGFGNGGGFALPTSGKVTAVSGSTITVDAVDFQTQKTASKSVTVGSATKYTQSQKAAASALAVGQCVVAQGKADDSGTVAATSIAVSAPVDGSCTTGFGFRGTRPNGGTGTGTGSDANGTVNG
jgi:hypothetical protein